MADLARRLECANDKKELVTSLMPWHSSSNFSHEGVDGLPSIGAGKVQCKGGPSVYIGDSVSDLHALLSVDIG